MHFVAINKDNLYETIANAIEEKILAKEFKPGDKLPSENQLAQIFGVSRNIVREALKALKERGLIEVKTGSGTYVSQPQIDQISENFNRLFILNDVLLDDFFDMRLLIETQACRLAAKNITEDQLAVLEKTIDDMNTYGVKSKQWAQAEELFHKVIAEASGNKVMYIYASSLFASMQIYLDEALNGQNCDKIVRYHQDIFNAIKLHNSDMAANAMENHLCTAREWMKTTSKQ